MVNFQLNRKGKPSEVLTLNKVDEEICIHFGAPVDPALYYRRWFGTIGLCLALGDSWDKIATTFPELKDVVDFMRDNYESTSWCS